MADPSSGFGWQEIVIIGVIFLMIMAPVILSPFWLPARRLTKRQTQALATGAAIAGAVLSRLGLPI